jgi:hypothetical protein
MKDMPTVFGGAGFGVVTITVGTRIPARSPGTTMRMRGTAAIMRSTAAIGFLPTEAFLGRGQQYNYEKNI